MNREEKQKVDLAKTMWQFSSLKSFDEMIINYKWYSLASGIKDEERTLRLMKEIKREGYIKVLGRC